MTIGQADPHPSQQHIEMSTKKIFRTVSHSEKEKKVLKDNLPKSPKNQFKDQNSSPKKDPESIKRKDKNKINKKLLI
jgi:hypothetical protein